MVDQGARYPEYRNRIGTCLSRTGTGSEPVSGPEGTRNAKRGGIFNQNMTTFVKKSTFNFSKYSLEIFDNRNRTGTATLLHGTPLILVA